MRVRTLGEGLTGVGQRLYPLTSILLGTLCPHPANLGSIS